MKSFFIVILTTYVVYITRFDQWDTFIHVIHQNTRNRIGVVAEILCVAGSMCGEWSDEYDWGQKVRWIHWTQPSERRVLGERSISWKPATLFIITLKTTSCTRKSICRTWWIFFVERGGLRCNYPQCSVISKWRRPYLYFLSSSILPGPEGPGNKVPNSAMWQN